jgi:threonine/homoserine/homoserine lactone efflux protein
VSLIVFIFSAIISFVGSLQLGPVNLFVINTALFRGNKAALMVAFGGILPEFIYCALAVYATGFVTKSEVFLVFFKIAFIGIMLTVAIYFWLKKTKLTFLEKEPPSLNEGMHVLKGFSLAAFNPQLLPFWMFVLIYFNSSSFLKVYSTTQEIAFIVGSGVGAFGLLLLLIVGVNKYKTKVVKYISHPLFFKLLAVLFFGIAIQQLVLLLKN